MFVSFWGVLIFSYSSKYHRIGKYPHQISYLLVSCNRCHSTNRHTVGNSIPSLNVWRWFDREIVDNQNRVQSVDGMYQDNIEIIEFCYYYFSIKLVNFRNRNIFLEFTNRIFASLYNK
jgi:hypothetical protein